MDAGYRVFRWKDHFICGLQKKGDWEISHYNEKKSRKTGDCFWVKIYTFTILISASFFKILTSTRFKIEFRNGINKSFKVLLIRFQNIYLRVGFHNDLHCVKSVPIRSYSGMYSVRMRENTDQNNSEYGHFSSSVPSTLD